VPAFTYSADSPERQFFTHINQQRGQCGFGLLAQSPALDASARAHARYVQARQLEGYAAFTEYFARPHFEIQGKGGFTGVSVADRARAAGYINPSSTTQVGSAPTFGIDPDGSTRNGLGSAAMAALNLTSSVYHMAALMGGSRDAGVGVEWTTTTLASPFTGMPERLAVSTVFMDLGYPEVPQRANSLRSYPCAGSVDVEPSFGSETPDPLAGSGLSYPVGQPVYLQAPRAATTLSVSALSIEPQNAPAGSVTFSTGSGNVLVLNSANDPHRYLSAAELVVIPHKPLLPDTTYRVRGSLQVDGVPQAVDYTFRTGPGYAVELRQPKYRVTP